MRVWKDKRKYEAPHQLKLSTSVVHTTTYNTYKIYFIAVFYAMHIKRAPTYIHPNIHTYIKLRHFSTQPSGGGSAFLTKGCRHHGGSRNHLLRGWRRRRNEWWPTAGRVRRGCLLRGAPGRSRPASRPLGGLLHHCWGDGGGRLRGSEAGLLRGNSRFPRWSPRISRPPRDDAL